MRPKDRGCGPARPAPGPAGRSGPGSGGGRRDGGVTAALARGVAAGHMVPVLCASAGKLVGIGTLLDAIVPLLPPRQVDPGGTLAALVFKTTADPFVGRISYVKVTAGT